MRKSGFFQKQRHNRFGVVCVQCQHRMDTWEAMRTQGMLCEWFRCAPVLFLKYRTTVLLVEIKPSAIFRRTPWLSLSVEPRKITRSTHSLRVPSWDSSTGSDTDSVHSVYDRERVPRGGG